MLPIAPMFPQSLPVIETAVYVLDECEGFTGRGNTGKPNEFHGLNVELLVMREIICTFPLQI